MHEMSLAEGILQLVEDTARREHATAVKAVILEIGQLSSVEPDALRFCFDAVARGSVAEGAELQIIDIPGAGWCLSCDAAIPLTERFGACPQCGSHQTQATGGTDMRVKAIDIQDEPAPKAAR